MIDSIGVERASGKCCKLEVVEIDSPLYRITEYDGFESLETPENQEWIKIE